MEVVYERCCGLDVHKRSVTACLIAPGEDGTPRKELRRFETMTEDLLALAEWLAGAGCTHVALESTGSYWKPIWNLLEDRFALLLVNAAHVKAVPGRKTDVKDAEWLAELLRHGLVRGSFVPDRAQRELRELVRYRTSLVEERAAQVNRLQKVLEGANIKLAAVASDVTGVSARAMLAALVAGQADAAALADLAVGRLREKLPRLERALAGRFGEHQRYLIPRILAGIDFLDGQIADLGQRIAELERPFDGAIERLDAIPGIGRRIAEIVLAELGADLGRFPTAGHLASWAGLCPGNRESGGKRLGGRTRKGNAHLRATLLEAAHAAARAKRSYLRALYRRLAARRGKKRALVAVAHAILLIIWHLLTSHRPYRDLGPEYFDRRAPEDLEQRLVRKLRSRGYTVTKNPDAA